VARQVLQARFEREHEEQRTRTRFERSLREWLANGRPVTSDALAGLLEEFAALRESARSGGPFGNIPSREAEQRIERWTQDSPLPAPRRCHRRKLVAGTSIDNAKLPERWQALERGT
jgi:hypothetical protein